MSSEQEAISKRQKRGYNDNRHVQTAVLRKFLGCTDNQIFLLMVFRYKVPVTRSKRRSGRRKLTLSGAMLLTLVSTQGKQELSLILSSYALPDVLRFDGSIKSYSLHCAAKLKSIQVGSLLKSLLLPLIHLKVRKNGQQKTGNLFCNIAVKRVE